MEWVIVIHDKDRYVEVITSGLADKEGSLNMAQGIAHAMKTHRVVKALIDHRNIDNVTGGVFAIYERPRVFRFIGEILRIKIAEIIKPEHLEHFGFFETVCRNQGYQLSIFQDKEKALTWLLA